MRGIVVVIGYGSTLRGDDAVGPLAAEAVAAWGRPGVLAIAVPQLTPELAEPLSVARLALFVDADLEGAGVRVTPIEPSGRPAASGHSGDPRSLLALARDAFGSCPVARLIAVPAVDLGMGEGLSPPAGRGLAEALRRIAAILDSAGAVGAGHA